MTGWIVELVRASCRRPWLVVALTAVACVAAWFYASHNFAMTTDTAQLISARTPWRQHEMAMDKAFPDAQSQFVVVVDGVTPELAEQGAAALTEALAQRKDVVAGVKRPDAGPFFSQNGLLYLSTREVQSTADDLITAQPMLGPLAADPSLHGITSSLTTMLSGVDHGDTDLASLDKPFKALAVAIEGVEQGRPVFFSWEKLMGDAGGARTPLRRLVLVKGRLDFGDLEPGNKVDEAIHKVATDLKLDAAHGVKVRVTGPVPLSDEEFSSLADKAWLVSGAMLGAIILMLWLATRSFRILACVLVTTLAGLLLTAAVGLVAVGRFNLISVAFIPLFVGLGIDFGIQLAVRFRAERLIDADLPEAMARAARGIGGALAVAAAAITLGLFAFLPTQYVGVSELGVIAGLGMVIALGLNLTLLPALLALVRPPPQQLEVGYKGLEPLDRFLIQRRKAVLWAFGAAVIVSIILVPWVRFDFNPLHLRNPKGEAMATLLGLMSDPDQTPNVIDVLKPSLAKADETARQLSALPQVNQTVTLSSFIPEDQAAKLAVVQDASLLLDPTLNPFELTAPAGDADTVTSLNEAAAGLRKSAAQLQTPAAVDARRLAAALEGLARGSPELRARAGEALVAPLNTMLNQIRGLLAAQQVTFQTLPPDLVRDWTTPDGRARVQVFPEGDSNDNATLVRFSKAVQAVAPDASGGPISIQEAARTIAGAFIEAGILSLIAIVVLLLVVLRSVRETAFTLAPVVLSGFLTLATCVLIGQPINFANIIAFPLLMGVGVAFHIYFVMAWRAGQTDLLQSSLTRAVFFSAMTTGMAFGSLWLSSHPGTASMGKILMISIVWTLVCALLFEPALLGPPAATARDPE